MATTKKSTIWWRVAKILTGLLVAETLSVAILNSFLPHLLDSEVANNLTCLIILLTSLAIAVTACEAEYEKLHVDEEEEK